MDVRMPDGTIVTNVPEGTTQEELRRRLGMKPEVSTGEDVARSALSAVPKAAAGILGFPGDVLGLVNRGVEKLVAMKHGGKPEDYRQPGLHDYVGSDTFRKPIEAVTGPLYEPQTRAGKVADTGIQTLATQGRNIVKNPVQTAKVVGAVTAGTEGAGALTNDNPWARFFGGLVGGGVPVAANATKSRMGQVVKDSIGDVDDAAIQEALRRQQAAQGQGVPLMGTESLDRGHQLASQVYASQRGNAIIDPFVKQRAGQTNKAVRDTIIRNTGSTDSAQEAAQRAQRASTNVLDDAEGARSTATKPWYKAAESETVPQQNIADAQAKIQAQLARYPEALFPDQRAAISEYLGKLGVPEARTSSFLDQLYRDARKAADAPEIGASDVQKKAAAAMGPVAAALKEASDVGSIKHGRDVHQTITRDVIDPLTSGPVGALAGKQGYVDGQLPSVPRMVNVLANEGITSPKEIKSLYTNLNRTDKQAFPGMVKTHIEQQLNQATGDIASGASSLAGGKFRAAVAGNEAQRANLDEMLRGVALAQGKNPDALVAGANRLLDTLERTGRTPGIGSQTAGRGEVSRELGRTKTGDVLTSFSGSPMGPFAARIDSWVMRGRYEELARVLTSSDSVEQLVRLAKIKPGSTSEQYLVAQILGLDRAIASGQERR